MAKNKVDIEIQLKAALAGREMKKFSQDAAKGLKNVKDESKQTAKGLKETSDESKGLSSSFGKLKVIAAATAAAFAAFKGLRSVVSFLKDSGKAAEEEEWAMRGLHQVLVSMKRDVPGFEQQMLDLASAMQLQTGYADDQIMTAIKFLSTYKEITNDVMPRALQLTLDIARGWGVDLRSAANMVGKAAMGMTGELRRYGITVDQDTYKSRGFIGVMEQIEDQVKGQAEAYRETTTGLKEWVQAVWGDVKEQFGYIVNQVLDPFRRAVGEILTELAGRLQTWREGVDLKTWAAETATKLKDLAIKAIPDLIAKLDEAVPKIQEHLRLTAEFFEKVSNSYEKIMSFLHYFGIGVKALSQFGKGPGGWAETFLKPKDTWVKDVLTDFDEIESGAEELKTTAETPIQPEVDITKATKSTEELSAEWKKIKAEMEKPITIHVKRETIYPGGRTEYEYEKGYKHGGPILPIPRAQQGITVPGFGGGDKHLYALEGGEEVIDKDTSRYARQHGIFDALREMARGGGTRDYMVLDLRVGEKSYPLTVEKGDVVEALMEDVRKHGMTRG